MGYKQFTGRINEQMLLGYVIAKQKQWQEVHDLLVEGEQMLRSEQCTLAEVSSWLWLLGEYTEQSKDQSLAEQYNPLILAIIARIAADWSKPALHWIYEDREGVYLSQVALHYAALRSAGFMVLSDTALRCSKEMRDQLFTTFMNGIAMVSEQGTAVVREDIVLATVPFGFFTPGDLALLKGLEVIDDTKLIGKEAAFFSWYYAECGKLAMARQLFSQAVQSESDSIYVQAAERILQLHLESDIAVFDHVPLGNECPYFSEDNERSPRTVLEQDKVTVKMIVRGQQQMEKVTLKYTVGSGVYAAVQMVYVEAVKLEQEPYWQGVIEHMPAESRISYYFEGVSETGIYESQHYSYEVYRWEKLECIAVRPAGTGTEEMEYDYALAGQTQVIAKMLVAKKAETGTQYRLSFSAGQELESNALEGAQLRIEGQLERLEQKQTETQLEKQNQLERVESKLQTEGQKQDVSLMPSITVLRNRHREVLKVKLAYEMKGETQWYGMGERFSQLSFQRCEVDNYVYNQYKDQGHRTYIPIPLAIGGDDFGVFLQSSLYSIFRFGTAAPTELEIEADVDSVQQKLMWSGLQGEPSQQIHQYTAITGKPKLPPKWAFGPWMSSNNWDSDQETRYQLDQNKKHEIAATVIVLEQWSDEATFYIFNDAQYKSKPGEERFTYNDFTFPAWGRWPDPQGLVERIHEDGLRLLLWQAPVMKYMEGLVHQQHDLDEATMIERGYMVKHSDGTPYRIPSFEWFRGSLVPDFTNEEASQWWLEQRQYLLNELKIDGFKTDGGECIYGSDLQFHDGRNGATMRNEYPNTYVQAFHQFANRFVDGGAITFSRAGYIGAQNTPMHWAGDEKSTFAAFRASIVAGLSSGLSGLPFWGWDMGGFSGEIPSAELYIRSTQMATFCPVMQYHAESKGQFNMDRTPWNIAERTNSANVLSIYKSYADLRMNILPYIYEQAQHSASTGEPLMRALCIDYPHDEIASQIQTQYMFGKQLLVAPIVHEGATETNMYFPEGSWVSLLESDAKVIHGGAYRTVGAAIEHIPVYMKENSIIPVHLNESLALPSHVGNSVELHKELVFIAYFNGAGGCSYTFIDEQAASVKIEMMEQNAHERLLSIEVEGQFQPVLWLKQAALCPDITRDGVTLKEVNEVEQLTTLSFIRRGDDILLRLAEGKQLVQCRM